MNRVSGSFRDPAGHVYSIDGRILRSVTASGLAQFDAVRATGLLDTLVEHGMLVPYQLLDASSLHEHGVDDAAMLLEHPRLAHISYPYEWSFSLLKTAALLHLDVQLMALEHGVMLSDATAYNVQFDGVKPLFIDHLSFRPYEEGEFWAGHRQFCEEFICPLLLRHYGGVAHNAWYRGELVGVPLAATAALLPLRAKLSWNVLTHIVAQARLQSGGDRGKAQAAVAKRKLPRTALRNMWVGLRQWVNGMRAPDAPTTWSEYADNTSYSDTETDAKAAFIREFVGEYRTHAVWDLGCNTGAYAAIAMEAGAERVIGFDADQGALEGAFQRASNLPKPFSPLFFDATNPVPAQGWNESERDGFGARANPDAILALALIHHLAIARNIPLADVIGWLISLAPRGVLEFVPKADPMVQALLQLREDIFVNYDEVHFLRAVEQHARIVKRQALSEGGRLLIAYERAAD